MEVAVETPTVINGTSENKVTGSPSAVNDKGEHELQSAWTFWYDKKNRTKTKEQEMNYAESLKKLGTFHTVEGFFRFFFNLFFLFFLFFFLFFSYCFFLI